MDKSPISPDAQLIDELGGVAKVCELLGYSKADGGLQRVSNWRRRGIPPAVKITRPDLFLRVEARAPEAAASRTIHAQASNRQRRGTDKPNHTRER